LGGLGGFWLTVGVRRLWREGPGLRPAGWVDESMGLVQGLGQLLDQGVE